MTRLRFVFLGVLMAIVVSGLISSPALQAQTLSSTAALSGTVSDPSGARVPKATIKLTDSEKGITRVFTSGSTGEFSFALLPAGTYTVEATALGFKTTRQSGVVLQVGDSLSLNIQLTIGATEQIAVTATGPLLQTEDADVSAEISQKQVEELPLNLRNVVGLVMLNSSVNNQAQQQTLSSGGAEDTADQDMSFLSFGGGFFGTTAFILDGGYNVAGGWGGVIYVPAVDAVQEFKVTTNSFSAEYGWSTGNVVNMVTKSGTSDFHFVADEYLRNQKLDANTYFNNLDKIAKNPDHRNQFGVAGGGPLYIPGIYRQREKTFFFANYEGLRLNQGGNFSANVPTPAEEGGDFSALLDTSVSVGTDCMGNPIYQGQIYNPYSTTLETSGPCAGTYYRSPYPGNIIPASGVGAIDALANKFATGNYWPASKNPSSQYNFNVAAAQATKSDEYGIRIDHNFNANNRIYGRWSQKYEEKSGLPPYYGASDIAGPGDTNPDNRYSIAFGGSHIFSPTFVLNGNVEYNRWVEGNVIQSAGFQASTLGLPGQIDQWSPQFPVVAINENYAPLGPQQGDGIFHTPNDAGTASIDLSKTHGAHSLSFGYMGVVNQIYDSNRVEATTFTFGQGQTQGPNPNSPTAGTGDAFASFMAGAGTSGSAGFNAEPASEYYLHGGYVQDTWKLNRKFTLSPGFRYEVQTPITERHNQQAYFDFHALNPISAVVGQPYYGEIAYNTPGNRDLYNFNYDDLAPRIGFAYNVVPKLVLRGGWGLYYARTFYGGGPDPGYSQSTPWVAVAPNGVSVENPLAKAFPTGLIQPSGSALEGLTNVGQGGGGVNLYHPDPRIKQFMGGIQYAFTSNDVLDVNYVGNRGTRITISGMNYGELNPSYLSMGSTLNNEVANPFTNTVMSNLGLANFSCQNSDGTLALAQTLEPYPEFCGGASGSDEPVGNSNYNSLQATFTHRTGYGLFFMASYTYSKFLDDVGGPEEWGSINSGFGGIGSIRNYYNLRGEYGVDSTDVPQSLALNYVYELPVGRGKKFGSSMNAAEDAIAGGWQISGITHVQEGFPLGIGNGGANGASVWGGNQHATIVPGVNPKSGTCPNGQSVGSGVCWFNGAAFTKTPAYQFGDAPRYFSNLRSPGYVDEDLGIQKWFNLTEKFRLQFTAQMFNAFNHANFQSPDTGIGDGTMGQVTATQGPRQVQLTLKLVR